MSVVETLSRPSPPYASGTSAPSSPISAALRSSSGIRPSFLCSSSSARGTTSPAKLFGDENFPGRAVFDEEASPADFFLGSYGRHVRPRYLFPRSAQRLPPLGATG